MAQTGRFASLSDGDLEGLILDKDAKNTKSVVRTAKKIMSDFLREKYGELKSLEELDEVDPNPVGKNSLGNKKSTECELSKRYTNHCIRSICITALDDGALQVNIRVLVGISQRRLLLRTAMNSARRKNGKCQKC